MLRSVTLLASVLFIGYSQGQKCVDNRRECRSWVSVCRTNAYVKNNCRLTCRVCRPSSRAPPCSFNDKHRSCSYWSKNNECTRAFTYMKANCPLACGFCVKTTTCTDLNKYCKAWQERGECRKNPSYMRENCKKSCKLCSAVKTATTRRPTTKTTTRRPTTTTTTRRPTTKRPITKKCTDDNESCEAWEKRGECTKNPKYMNVNCRKACGLCKVPTKSPVVTSVPTTSSPVTELLRCGINKYNHPFRKFVVGGEDSDRGKWIWQASISYYDVYSCGGTLIAPQYVLTAAHCLNDGADRDKEGLDITLGDHTRDKKERSEQHFKVEKFWVHEEYGNLNKIDMNADIALIKLDRPAVLSSQIGLACLPEAKSDVDIKSKCYISGWGKMSASGSSVNILQDAKLPLVTNEVCGKHNTDYAGQSAINQNMLCAGSSTKNVGGCNGDSGGPFVCQNKRKQWVVEGAVSWGSSQCDSRLMYTVFARVSNYVDWIKKHMK